MKLEDFKNGIDNIKPDPYMETRLAQNVLEAAPKKRSKRKLAIAAVSGFLSLAVLITGLGFGGLWRSQNFYVGNDGSCVLPKENAFILSVYASETDEPIYTQIGDDTVILPDFNLNDVLFFYPDRGMAYAVNDDLSFEIKGENIKSVRVQCEINEFLITDFAKLGYLKANGKLYDLVVPYSDEYTEDDIDNKGIRIMFEHIENGDYDEYVAGKELKNADEYAYVEIIYDENENAIGAGLLSLETYSKIHPTSIGGLLEKDRDIVNDYTFVNLLEEEEFSCLTVMAPLHWYEILFEDQNMPFSQLPHETVKIDVTFNDGTVKHGKYDLSFNDSGELVIKTLA